MGCALATPVKPGRNQCCSAVSLPLQVGNASLRVPSLDLLAEGGTLHEVALVQLVAVQR